MISADLPKIIRVLLADDHQMVRKGVRSWLEEYNDIEVVDEVQRANDVVLKIEQHKPDVLIIDLHFPDGHGLDVVRLLRAEGHSTRILVMTGYERQRAKQAIEAGANGFLNKEESKERVIEAVRWAAAREPGVWLSPALAQEVLASTNAVATAQLTKTELSILKHIELPNSKIAELLFVSEGTIKNHVSNIYAKLGVRTRSEAHEWARQHDIM